MQSHHTSYIGRFTARAAFQCRLRALALLGMVMIGGVAPHTFVFAQNTVSTPAWLQQPMSLADARHLAGRTGFGAAPGELAALIDTPRIDAVNAIVDALATQPHIPMPAWVSAPAPHFWKRRFLSQPLKQAFDANRDKEIVELRRWWVNNMLQTSSPQTERLVLFWHDHFATSYDGVNRRSVSMARQNQLFREMGSGSYRALLKAIIRDPAMLLYLDNQSNRKGSPNENLARELLELFTLGEGNYDELTVKEAARALTGYGISETHNHSFKFHGNKRDMSEKTLFGKTAAHDGDALIDLILEQPEAADYLVKKFWHAFISDSTVNPAFVDTVSRQFRQSDYNLQLLYRAVLMSEAFWHEDNRLALIKSPATLLIGTARSLDFPKRAWTQMPSLLALLGMDLFSPPNVAGWNEGAAFVIPGRLLNRQLAMQSLLSVPETWSLANRGMQMGDSNMTKQMTASSQMPTSKPNGAKSALQLRVAGHLYRGAPQYEVSLYGAEEKVLWTSETRSVDVGYDTETFGKMRDMSQLAWQTAYFNPPADALAKSVRIKIKFLNDAASKTGDRNLFVESVSINRKLYSSSGAQQESECPPNNSFYAGRLYCAGNITIELTNNTEQGVARDAPYTATSASLLWVQQKKQKLVATIALENVQTPNGDFHTVSFYVRSKNENHLELSFDSYGCWPDCIEQWPECAWVDDRSQQRSMAFPLRRGGNEQLRCQYESLTNDERALVSALYASLPDLIRQHLHDKAKNGKHKAVLQKWQERMDNLEPLIMASHYGVSSAPVQFNPQYTKPVQKTVALGEPEITISNVETYAKLANDVNLSPAELLIGGAPAKLFPELLRNTTMPIEIQLENLLTHPVYQVY